MRSFYDLGNGDELVDAAIQLSRFRQVVVRPATREAATSLGHHGFVPIVDALHVLASRSAQSMRSMHSSRRRQLRVHAAAFEQLNFEVHVLSGSKVAQLPELAKRLYYGLVVPDVYCRGISPYGVQSESRFIQILERSIVVVAVDEGGTVHAASLYEVASG